MKQKPKTLQSWQYDRALFRILISPSWISGLFCTLASVAITVTLLLQAQYEGGGLKDQFFAWQQAGEGVSLLQTVIQMQYSSLGGILGTLQLFIFWYLVGLLLYTVLSTLYQTIQRVRLVKRDLGYINASRRSILLDVTLRLGRQLLALTAWAAAIIATLRFVAPYTFTTIESASQQLPSVNGALYVVATIVGLTLCLHIHIILIRLFVGRPRMWNSQAYMGSLH